MSKKKLIFVEGQPSSLRLESHLIITLTGLSYIENKVLKLKIVNKVPKPSF